MEIGYIIASILILIGLGWFAINCLILDKEKDYEERKNRK